MNPFMGLSTTINCCSSNAKVVFVRCLILCFINITLVLFGGLLFQGIEGSYELAYKCGVKRVHRDFIDSLWNETSSLNEIDWKSSARHKLMAFENELHEAVEAGVYSYSGQKSWTITNSILYVFSVISTMGFGPLSCSTRLCRILTCVFVIIGTPLFYLLITELATLSILLYNLYGTKKEKTSLIQPVESLTCILGYTMLSLGALYTLLCFINPLDSLYMVTGFISTNGFTDLLPQDTYIILLTSGFIILSISVFNLFLISAQVRIRAFLDSLFKKYNIYSIDGSTKLEAKNGNKEH